MALTLHISKVQTPVKAVRVGQFSAMLAEYVSGPLNGKFADFDVPKGSLKNSLQQGLRNAAERHGYDVMFNNINAHTVSFKATARKDVSEYVPLPSIAN